MGAVTDPSGGNPGLSAPTPISGEHDVSAFDCGKAPLDDWLRQHALRNEGRASRCFVVCDGATVAGYYSLTMGSVLREQAPKPLTRSMPPQIPVVILGRLAVDQRYHGRKIGPALLRNALQRSLAASTEVAARAVLVHAIDLEVVSFYTQYGFKPFPEGSLTLFLSVAEIVDAIT